MSVTMFGLPVYVGLVAGGIVCILMARLLSKRKHNLSQPPGPQGYPFLGYLKSIETPSWKTYRRWSIYYGSDLIRLNIMGNNIIVLNSLRSAIDLLDKRSSIYSSRPVSTLTMIRELGGFDWNLGFAPYGTYWKDARRAMQQAFNTQAAATYRSAEMKAVRKMLLDLLRDPSGFLEHTRFMSGRTIMEVTYGLEVQDHDNEYLKISEQGVALANRILVPGAYLVDSIPMLKHIPAWFPGASFKRQANEWRKLAHRIANEPFAASLAHVDLPDSAAKILFNKFGDGSSSAEYMRHTVCKGSFATMYSAGTDTITSVLDRFFLAMCLHPDIQREAQQVIDGVCKDQLPDFSQYNELPYVHAIVKECLRWNPSVPLAVPHMVTEDDVYDGYHIPANSAVFANVWAILHDPDTYSQPETFEPERFLMRTPTVGVHHNVELNPNVLDPATVIFGFGRRICPGRLMAYDTLWIAIVSILASFDVSSVVGADGKPIVPNAEFTESFFSRPKDFTCLVRPRSSVHVSLITARG